MTVGQAAASAPEQYESLVGLLLAILVLELVSRKLRLPPAAAFILGGGLIAVIPGIPTFSIDPNLVMVIFLPPLLMNGGYLMAQQITSTLPTFGFSLHSGARRTHMPPHPLIETTFGGAVPRWAK